MKWLLILLIAGCAMKQATKTDIIWSQGCLLMVKDTTVEEVKELNKELDIDGCTVKFKETKK